MYSKTRLKRNPVFRGKTLQFGGYGDHSIQTKYLN